MSELEKTVNEFEELLASINAYKKDIAELQRDRDNIKNELEDECVKLDNVKSQYDKVSEDLKRQQIGSKRVFDQETKRLDDREKKLNDDIAETESLKKKLKTEIATLDAERKSLTEQMKKTVKSDNEIKHLNDLAKVDREDGTLLLSAAKKTNIEALDLLEKARAEKDDAFAATTEALSLQSKNKEETNRLISICKDLDNREAKIKADNDKLCKDKDELNNREVGIMNAEEAIKVSLKNIEDKEKNIENTKKELALSIAKYRMKK